MQLLGPHQGREGGRHIVQHARLAAVFSGLFGALGRLERFPGLLDRRLAARRPIAGGAVAEHMGVAADQLVGDGAGDVVEGESVGFLGHAGMEDHLQQQIAKLVAQRGHVPPVDRVGDLVGLFDGVGRDGGEVLLQVPGAAVLRVAQAAHDRQEFADVVVLLLAHAQASAKRTVTAAPPSSLSPISISPP